MSGLPLPLTRSLFSLPIPLSDLQAAVGFTGGTGQINAYLYGADMFQANINTCGVGQQIDILGVATATLDAPVSPVTPGGTATMGLSLPIPQEAAGLGTLNITLAAADTNSRQVYCFDLVVTI